MYSEKTKEIIAYLEFNCRFDANLTPLSLTKIERYVLAQKLGHQEKVNAIITYVVMNCDCVIERGDIIAVSNILKKRDPANQSKATYDKNKVIFDHLINKSKEKMLNEEIKGKSIFERIFGFKPEDHIHEEKQKDHRCDGICVCGHDCFRSKPNREVKMRVIEVGFDELPEELRNIIAADLVNGALNNIVNDSRKKAPLNPRSGRGSDENSHRGLFGQPCRCGIV